MAEERQITDFFAENVETGRNFKLHYAELVKQAKPIMFPLFELPFQKNTQFTGREEQLAQISDCLLQQNTLAITNSVNAVLAQAIAGLGGVGKSQLAIEYAYRAYEQKSYQIIWFMNGQNLDGDYLRLAAQLKIYGENKDDIIERAKRKLEELGNYLLIIDDAENYETIKNYLPQTGNNGHVLITTRHRADWQKMLELGVFTLVEALEYFKKVTDFKEEEREDVVKLVDKLLGLLPLALTQVGAFIKQTSVSVKEYIDFFETKLTELWGVEDKARDYSQTIAVTWEITISRVKEKYPQAEDLLRGMSCLAPTPNKIDQSWLIGLVEKDLDRMLALAELAAYSMIEKHQELNNFSIHALVQEVVYDNMPKQKAEGYLESIYATLKNNFPFKEFEQMEDFETQRKLIPHLESFLKCAEKFEKDQQETFGEYTVCIKPFFKFNTILLLSHCYRSIGERKDEKKILEYLLEEINEYYGSETVETTTLTATVLVNLGNACAILGELIKGKAYIERALLLEEKYYKQEHISIANTLASLGSVCRMSGDAYKAKELLERALKISLRYYSAEHIFVAKILMSLGSVYGNLGELKKQKALFDQVLHIYEKYYGYEHVNTALIIMNLANTYGKLGDARKSKELLERVLEINKKYYGAKHIALAENLINLGTTCRETGEISKSLILFEQALKIIEEYYGENHFQVAIVLTNLGEVRRVLGYFQASKENLEKALKMKEKFYGNEHIEISPTLISLGNTYGALGDKRKGKHFLKRALIINEKYYGLEHVELTRALCDLGSVYLTLKNAKKAIELFERSLKIKEKHYGLGHIGLAQVLMNLGLAYLCVEDDEKAKGLLKHSLRIKEKYYGRKHPETSLVIFNLAVVYHKAKNFSKSCKYAKEAYAIFLNHQDCGPQHSHTQKAKSLLDKYAELTAALSSSSPSFFAQPKSTLQSEDSIDLGKQLRNAANQNNVELLSQLVKENKNLNLNAQDDGQHQRSALHWAVVKEAISCIKVLLQARADIYLQDKAGKSALDYASELQAPTVLSLLLSHRYQLSLEGEIDVGKLLRRAAHEGDADVIQKLLKKWPNKVNEKDQGKAGRTALHWAVIKGHVNCVKILLAEGANSSILDKENYSAIDWGKKLNLLKINQLFEGVTTTKFFQPFVSSEEASSSSGFSLKPSKL